jgi:hypothetical protein
MEFGSLINLVSTSTTKPEVGMGCTICFWTDRKAGTIVKVTPKGIEVQEDTSIRTDNNGMSEVQSYQHITNTNGTIYKFRLNKKGQYRNTSTGLKALVGVRNAYYDYCF